MTIPPSAMPAHGGLPPVASTPEINTLIAAGAAIAIGVSGGKDSQAAALATIAYLRDKGAAGPCVLIHADLGMVEWTESLPVCEELARYLDLPLHVVRRKNGGLMERWEQRWASSKRRYAAMETMRLVLPWSTPAMRFCTSDAKRSPLLSEMRRLFPDRPVINVTGVRAEESSSRAKQPVASKDLANSIASRPIWDWRPIHHWTTAEVFACIADTPLQPHRAYTEFGSSRVSCRWCILASGHDLAASAQDPAATPLYRRMVQLEIDSSFAFQGARWLGDVAPHLLDPNQRAALARAKANAGLRKRLEAEIPQDLRFDGRRPTRLPSHIEAIRIARARIQIGKALSIDDMQFQDPHEIRQHLGLLMNPDKLLSAA